MEKDSRSLSRTEKIKYESFELTNEYFLDSESEKRSRRPDVIVLEVEKGAGVEYLITEVTYSARKETVKRGIEELLEYLAFLRDDGDIVYDEPKIFGSGWNGILVTQDIEGERTRPIEEQRLVRILQASEVESELSAVVEKILDYMVRFLRVAHSVSRF